MTIKRRYTLWAVTLLLVVASAGAIAQDRPGPAAEMNEGDLIALLLSDAPAAKKAITCKQLAIYGTDQAVPALAPLGHFRMIWWVKLSPSLTVTDSKPNIFMRSRKVKSSSTE